MLRRWKTDEGSTKDKLDVMEGMLKPKDQKNCLWNRFCMTYDDDAAAAAADDDGGDDDDDDDDDDDYDDDDDGDGDKDGNDNDDDGNDDGVREDDRHHHLTLARCTNLTY